jgi:stage V sporulation protein D (sporulation-specific penicillin-binding protein)
VAGYRVAAKTGTSEKKGAEFAEKDAYICSTVAFAPADDPEIAIIIIVDEPTKGVLYGSTVAAPYVADALENIMPYLGVTPIYTEAEQAKMAVTVPNCRKMTLTEAIAKLEQAGLSYTVVGEQNGGAMVSTQSPSPYTKVEKSSGRVVLYTGGATPTSDVEVPDLIGKNAVQANAMLMGCGLNVRIVGSSGVLSGTDTLVCAQSVAAGTMVPKGTVVTITFTTGPDENPDYESPVG